MKKYGVNIDIDPQEEDDAVPSFESDVTVWRPTVRGPGNTDGYTMAVMAATALRKALKCRKGNFDFCPDEVCNIAIEKFFKAKWTGDNESPCCDYLHGVLYYRNKCYQHTIETTDLSSCIHLTPTKID